MLASSCGERLAIDLISVKNFLEYNKGYSYILSAIDFCLERYFKNIKNIKASTVLTALKSIFAGMTFKAHIVQSDMPLLTRVL